MKSRIKMPSPAMVVAVVSLFVALGGASYAAIKVPKNSVGTKQLKNAAVDSAKVKDGALKAADFEAGQLPTGGYGSCGSSASSGAGDYCTILTTSYQLIKSTTVSTKAGGKLIAVASNNMYRTSSAGTAGTFRCRVEASGPGISGRQPISKVIWGDAYEQNEDVEVTVVGSKQVGAGTFVVGVYCLSDAAPNPTIQAYSSSLTGFVVR